MQLINTSQHNIRSYKSVKVGPIDFYLCPKCGTNTIKYASYLYNGGKKLVSDIRDSSYDILRNNRGEIDYSLERKDAIRIAVKRDPVERFQSALLWYNYKYSQNVAVEDVFKYNIADPHFYSQTQFYKEPDRYDHIIEISEITDIIHMITGKCLGKIHKGQQVKNRMTLTMLQEEMIRKNYEIDYENSYC